MYVLTQACMHTHTHRDSHGAENVTLWHLLYKASSYIATCQHIHTHTHHTQHMHRAWISEGVHSIAKDFKGIVLAL